MGDESRVRIQIYLKPSTVAALEKLGEAMGKTPTSCAAGFLEEAEGSLLGMAKAVNALNRSVLPAPRNLRARPV